MARPRVRLCPDIRNWACDNISDQILRPHGDRFSFERYGMAGSMGSPNVFLNQAFNFMGEFDIIHVFWREDVQRLPNPKTVFRAATGFNFSPETLFDRLGRPVITSSLHDHLFPEPGHFPRRERAFGVTDGDVVSSRLLDRVHRGIAVFPDPLALPPDDPVDAGRHHHRLSRVAAAPRSARGRFIHLEG